MALPTETDYMKDAPQYATERHKLLTYNFCLLRDPHLYSKHVFIRISYNYTTDGERMLNPCDNIYVEIIPRPSFCKKISCNSYYPFGKTCKPDDGPKLFKSGNTDVTACEWGCYAAFRYTRPFNKPKTPEEIAAEKDKDKDDDKTQEEKDKEQKEKENDGTSFLNSYYRMPLTMYSQNNQCCIMMDNNHFRFGIDPVSRSDRSVPRLTTIGTGDDLSDSLYRLDDDETFHFKLNRYRCDDAKLEFKNGECEPSWGEKIVGWTIGSTIYKAFQYGDRWFNDHIPATANSRPNVPPVNEANRPPSYDQWLDDIDIRARPIDPYVQLTDLGIAHAGLKGYIWTTEYGEPRLIAPALIYKTVPVPPPYGPEEVQRIRPRSRNLSIENRDFELETKNSTYYFKRKIHGRRDYTDELILGLRDNIEREPMPEDHNDAFLRIFELMYSLLEGYVQQKIFDTVIEKFLQKMLKKLLQTLSQKMVNVAGKLFFSSFAATIMPAMAMNALKYGVMVVVQASLKMLLSMLNIVLVVTTVLNLIDMIIGFMDLFGMSNVESQPHLDQYSYNDIVQKRLIYGFGTFPFTPLLTMYTSLKAREDRIAWENLKPIPEESKDEIDTSIFASLCDMLNEKTPLQSSDADVLALLKKYYPKEMFLSNRLSSDPADEYAAYQDPLRPPSSDGVFISFADIAYPSDAGLHLQLQARYIYGLRANSDNILIDFKADSPYIRTENGIELPPIGIDDLATYYSDEFIKKVSESIPKPDGGASVNDPATNPLESESMAKRVQYAQYLGISFIVVYPILLVVIGSAYGLLYLLVFFSYLIVHFLHQLPVGVL